MAFKTTVIGRLTDPFQVPTVQGTVYTASSGGNQDIIKRIFFFNTNGSAETIQIWVAKTGGSAGTSNQLDERSIPANSAYVWEGEYMCNAGDLVIMVSTASGVSCHIIGTTFGQA